MQGLSRVSKPIVAQSISRTTGTLESLIHFEKMLGNNITGGSRLMLLLGPGKNSH